MSIEPRIVADYACATGEGPLWHPDERRVYWVDIPRGRLFRYDPASGRHEQVFESGSLGGFTIQEDGSFLFFMERGAVRHWRDGRLTTIVEEIPEERESRFNDVMADTAGRVLCGTMPSPDHAGRLYRLELDGSLTVLLEGVEISNGMGFTPDRTGLYYTESGKRTIWLFDYDHESGDISNQRVFLQTPAGEGIPDGMAVDAEGYVWSARWDGWSLFRYAPDGSEARRIRFPAKKVSSVTFGGDDYTDIYVTTAGAYDKDENGPGAGGLFHLNLGIKGVPEYRSRVRV